MQRLKSTSLRMFFFSRKTLSHFDFTEEKYNIMMFVNYFRYIKFYCQLQLRFLLDL